MLLKKNISWKPVFTGLTLGFSVLLVNAQSADAVNIYVDDDSCTGVGTGYADGSGTDVDPYCKIQKGIDMAAAGDDVLVNPGNYFSFSMKSGVDVLDADDTDEIKPRLIPDPDSLIRVQFAPGVQNCTLDGFVLDDTESTADHAMVWMCGHYNKYPNDSRHSKNLSITNCDFIGNAEFSRAGVSVHATLQNVRIANNTFLDINGTAIVVGKHAPTAWPLKYCSLTIEDNLIENNAWAGIYLKSEAKMWNRVSIKNNVIQRNQSLKPNGFAQGHMGIGLVNIHRGYFNGVPRNESNKTVPYCGDTEANTCGAIVEGNVISEHYLTGLLLEKTWTVAPHIANNTIFANTLSGINIVGYSRVSIVDNDIFQNGRSGIGFNANYLIHSDPSSEAVLIEGNNLYENFRAGIGMVDYVTGPLIIRANNLHDNVKAGIALFNAADAIEISDNDIHDNDTAGIYTGKWRGILPAKHYYEDDIKFDRRNGPVHVNIFRNKIYNNLAGMRIDHASGTVSNNLVYNNVQAGIRFSGKNVGAYEPFGMADAAPICTENCIEQCDGKPLSCQSACETDNCTAANFGFVWGIASVNNNTVSDNGKSGIVYDNINYVPGAARPGDGSDMDGDGYRDFTDGPRMYRIDGIDPAPIFMMNNITSWNATLGIRDSTCNTTIRDFNLAYYNFNTNNNPRRQFGSCPRNPNEIVGAIFVDHTDADPLYVDRGAGNFRLQTGSPQSPAVGAGQDGFDMGAFGGVDPMGW